MVPLILEIPHHALGQHEVLVPAILDWFPASSSRSWWTTQWWLLYILLESLPVTNGADSWVVYLKIIWASTWEKRVFTYAKTKTQISFAVTAKLISAFVFATKIVRSLYFLNPKFQASSHLLLLYSPVCVGPGRKPRRPFFSERGSFHYVNMSMQYITGHWHSMFK